MIPGRQHSLMLLDRWAADPVDASFAVDVLEDGFIQAQLQAGLVKHLPLVGVAGDESVDLHRLPLANPMAAGLGLQGSTEGEGLSCREAFEGIIIQRNRSKPRASPGRRTEGVLQHTSSPGQEVDN